jgi:ferritin-like protein
MSHEGLHEPFDLLTPETRNLHRAIISLMEELEAIDWYQQRVDACDDPALKAVLLHNRNEEVEHGMMTLEWLRRRDPVFDKFMRRYLFTEQDIIEIEEAADVEEAKEEAARAAGQGGPKGAAGDGSLVIRGLRGA